MAIRTRDELLNSVRGLLGDRTDDEALAALEDFTDTVGDYERRVAESGDWKRKYDENDAAWRQRYRDRFENGTSLDEDYTRGEHVTTEEQTEVVEEHREWGDLFETK